jgi:anti-anti-sigma factor
VPGSTAFRAVPTASPRGFRLEGEIDLSNADTLSELLRDEIEAQGDLTLDMSQVTFMDSTAIRALLSAGKRLQGRGRLVLLRPGSLVANVLRLIRADQMPGILVVEDASGAPSA